MAFYRFILILAAPVVLALALWRALRGQLVPGEIGERLGGLSPLPQPPNVPRIWLHGASNGELTSARWLIETMLTRAPDLHLVVTANSGTGRDMVRGWKLARVAAVLAPLDTRNATARFLARWRPTALIVVENELWPNRITTCAARGIPVAVIGARISARSARIWHRLPGLARTILSGITALSAQDGASETRLLALGLPPDRLAPRATLKSGPLAPPASPAPFANPVARHRTLLAASTHEGEDAAILDAFASARATGAFDLLILAPRHPRRAPDIIRLIKSRGLPFASRASREVPGPGTAVFLADTLGEMAHWYAMSGACFIGGTLVPKGGHTPWEPAAHDCAIIHGPDTANFTEVFASLDTEGGALAIPDGPALALTLTRLDAQTQTNMAKNAKQILASTGGPEPIWTLLARTTGLPALAG